MNLLQFKRPQLLKLVAKPSIASSCEVATLMKEVDAVGEAVS